MGTKKVWVTAKRGRYVPGLGTRGQGEAFEVDAKLAEQLEKMDGFSDRNPNRASKPERAEPTGEIKEGE